MSPPRAVRHSPGRSPKCADSCLMSCPVHPSSRPPYPSTPRDALLPRHHSLSSFSMKTSRERSSKQGAGCCLQTSPGNTSAYPEFYADTRIRPAPERFLETWIDLLGGFLFCVVLPIPIYVPETPFTAGIGATEQTIL